jgi:hypothetical protein
LLCGALLLEQENEQILKYFEPNVDFVFFSTPVELKEKILFYFSQNKFRNIYIRSNCLLIQF